MPLVPSFFALAMLPTALADAAVERRLYPDRVDASSFLWNDWNRFQENYHPLYAVDDDPSTAWVEGATGAGAGEWMRLDVTDLDGTSAVRLKVRNGYQKSASLWKANARAKDVVVRLLPSGVEARATLLDQDGWQELTVSQPVGAFQGVELRVASVYPGSRYQDLCISDVEVYATSTTRDNPVAETAKLARVKAWKADRVAAAALFKAGADARMPLAQSYTLRAVGPERDWEEVKTPYEGLARMLTRLRALPPAPGFADVTREINVALAGADSQFGAWLPVQVTPTDTRPIPELDALGAGTLWSCFDGPPVWGDVATGEAYGRVELPTAGRLGYLRADMLGVFEVKHPVAVQAAIDAKGPACGQRAQDGRPAYTYAWARMSPAAGDRPARVEALFTASCGTIEVREGSEQVAASQVLVYDTQGRLAVIAGPQFATQFAWRGEGDAAVITAARRVGAFGPDFVLNEGRAVATP